mgnify:FL=1
MKRLFLLAFSIFIFSTSSFAVTYNSEPKIFIAELVGDAIKTLSDKSISQEDKKKIIEKIALENVDIDALGMYTLGDTRKTLEKNILNNYKNLFKQYFLKTLTSRLTDYSSNKFEVLGSEQKSSTYTIVQSRIIESDNQPELKIDWRVYTKDPLKPLIRDLIVEGLSLARTQKEEFASISSSYNNDINLLIAKLEEFVNN